MNARQQEGFRLRAYHLGPLPFHRFSKTPAFEEGEIFKYRGRRLSDTELRTMFADPDCNIGVFTGDGHVVVDIDGEEGRQSLMDHQLDLPDTVAVISSDDAHAHLHYRTAERIHSRIRPVPGVDILGEDWQVLMPSSNHPDGARYRYAPQHALADMPLAPAPSWIGTLCFPSPLEGNSVLSVEREQVSKRESLLVDGRARVATDMPERSVESLLAPCTFPTTTDALGGWPELLRREDVNLRAVGYLGLLAVEIGDRFACPMPGHPTNARGASLYWDVHGKAPTGMLKLRDWHYATGDGTYNQADIFASRNYGSALQLNGPEITVWQIRLLLASGVLLPYPITAPSLPLKTPLHIRRVYDGFITLLRCKWLHTPDAPTPFTWRFAAAWCGMRSAGQVVYAMRWLLRNGYVRQAGSYKRMALFLPGKEA